MGKAGDVNILGKKSRKALEQSKAVQEKVLLCIQGNSDQAIVALDHRLLVIKPGFMAGASFGAKVTSFNYSDIRGIEVRSGMLSAFLEISSGGFEAASGAHTKVFEKDEKRDPYKLANCLPCAKRDLQTFKPYLDRLQELITESKRPVAVTTAGATTPENPRTIAGELEKLAALRTTGVLTDDEFQQAKSRLLHQ